MSPPPQPIFCNRPNQRLDIPPFDEDYYKRMYVQDVFPFFISLPSEFESAKRLDILSFIQNAKPRRGSSAWKELFKAYWRMTETWHSSADELILLAGLPSIGKSVVLEHLRHKLFPVQPEADLSAKREWHCIGPGKGFRFMRLAIAKTDWKVESSFKERLHSTQFFVWRHRAKAVCQSMLHQVNARL